MKVWRMEEAYNDKQQQQQQWEQQVRVAGSAGGSTSVRGGMGGGHTTVKQRGLTTTTLSLKACDSPLSGANAASGAMASKAELLGGKPLLRVNTAPKAMSAGGKLLSPLCSPTDVFFSSHSALFCLAALSLFFLLVLVMGHFLLEHAIEGHQAGENRLNLLHVLASAAGLQLDGSVATAIR
jgi:hypothetical protein